MFNAVIGSIREADGPVVEPMVPTPRVVSDDTRQPSPATVAQADFAAMALGNFRSLRAVALRLTRNPSDADDLLQETYQLAFQSYRELRNLTHGKAWLMRILHRRAITRHRREQSAPLLLSGDLSETESPETAALCSGDEELSHHVALQEIRAAIAALPTDLRMAVTLCDIEGFSYAEIARLTNSTVRSRIARARGRLMKRLRSQAEAWGIRPKPAYSIVPLERERRPRAQRRPESIRE